MSCAFVRPDHGHGLTTTFKGGWTARRAAGLIATGLLAAATAAPSAAAPRNAPPDPELLQDLLRWAGRLSAIATPAALPTLTALPVAELARHVWPDQPDHCRTLIAVYDTDRRGPRRGLLQHPGSSPGA